MGKVIMIRASQSSFFMQYPVQKYLMAGLLTSTNVADNGVDYSPRELVRCTTTITIESCPVLS
jgi:hypothetical protein